VLAAYHQGCKRTLFSELTLLCAVHVLAGVGIGGDYPLSATIMSEYASKKTRGAFVAAVFAMQGLGILVAAAVTLIVACAFKNLAPETPENADYVWRIVLGFSAFPTAATLYMRAKMPETARFTLLVEQNAAKALADMSGEQQQLTPLATLSSLKVLC
jgi:MFS transporter, PHS family, inorganic phosphate transporter